MADWIARELLNLQAFIEPGPGPFNADSASGAGGSISLSGTKADILLTSQATLGTEGASVQAINVPGLMVANNSSLTAFFNVSFLFEDDGFGLAVPGAEAKRFGFLDFSLLLHGSYSYTASGGANLVMEVALGAIQAFKKGTFLANTSNPNIGSLPPSGQDFLIDVSEP